MLLWSLLQCFQRRNGWKSFHKTKSEEGLVQVQRKKIKKIKYKLNLYARNKQIQNTERKLLPFGEKRLQFSDTLCFIEIHVYQLFLLLLCSIWYAIKLCAIKYDLFLIFFFITIC